MSTSGTFSQFVSPWPVLVSWKAR